MGGFILDEVMPKVKCKNKNVKIKRIKN